MITYIEAPESVINIAKALIAEYHPWLKMCSIGFVLFEGDKQSMGKFVVGKTSKVTPKMVPLLSEPVDFVIEISADYWARSDSDRAKALIDHELCHIRLTKTGYGMQAHDFEEFAQIIDRWGLWTSELVSASAAFARHVPAEQLQLPIEGAEGKVVAIKGFAGVQGEA
jgi:predicted metallopeptidase